MAEITIILLVALGGLLVSKPIDLIDVAVAVIFTVGATGTVLLRAIKEERDG